jgi:hypothetical protein
MIYSKKAIQFISGMVDKMVKENKMIAEDSLAKQRRLVEESVSMQNAAITRLAASVEELSEIVQTQTEQQADLISTLAKYFSLEIKRSMEDEANRKAVLPPTEHDLKF